MINFEICSTEALENIVRTTRSAGTREMAEKELGERNAERGTRSADGGGTGSLFDPPTSGRAGLRRGASGGEAAGAENAQRPTPNAQRRMGK